MGKKTNWLKNPSKSQIATILTTGLIGISLLILSMTDLFRESPFQRKYLMLYLLILSTIIVMTRACINYIKSKQETKSIFEN